MFAQLLASRPAQLRRRSGIGVSVVVHVVVIGAAWHRSGVAHVHVTPSGTIIYLHPPEPKTLHSPSRPAHTSAQPIPRMPSDPVSLPIPPAGPVPITLPSPGLLFPPAGAEQGAAVSSATAGDPTQNPAGERPYGEFEVDKVAAAAPGSPPPVYPADLRAAGVEGLVRMRYVVDTLGRADPASISVVSTDDPQFASAAREAIRRTHYYPAEAGGHKVAQLVEQLFAFRITR